jgi:hypothetical protein
MSDARWNGPRKYGVRDGSEERSRVDDERVVTHIPAECSLDCCLLPSSSARFFGLAYL